MSSEMTAKKAIVLLSGGLDSTTVVAYAQSKGFDVYAISFSYGQKHNTELEAAKKIAEQFKIKHHAIMNFDFAPLSHSALTQSNIAVPDYDGGLDIPATYVPARNTVFLSIAMGWAETLNAHDIFIGVSAIDYSGYPDCRPEYIAAYQAMADLATKTGVEGNPIKIHTPLIDLSKAETIMLGLDLGVDYSQTISCYQASEKGFACGKCDSCTLRRMGFEAANVADPTKYCTANS